MIRVCGSAFAGAAGRDLGGDLDFSTSLLGPAGLRARKLVRHRGGNGASEPDSGRCESHHVIVRLDCSPQAPFC